MKKLNKLMFAGFITFVYLFGILTNYILTEPKIIYKDKIIYKELELEGLYTSNDFNFKGDWVHVNIENMSFKRAFEVCQHETYHEIWAECGESNDLEYCINKYEEEHES